MLAAVAALTPGDPAGFTPEALAGVEDLSLVLPAGARVEPVDATIDITGDLASVDAVVRVAGQPEQRYWVFMQQRDGQWLVSMTIPLEP